MVYGRYIELVNGVYKATYNWGAQPCSSSLLSISSGHNFLRSQISGDLELFLSAGKNHGPPGRNIQDGTFNE